MIRRVALLACLALVGPPSAVAQETCPALRTLPCTPPPPPPPTPPPPPPCESEACEALSEQLDRGCQPAADAPYADTIFLRRETGIELPEEAARRITAAALATDPEVARDIVAPVLEGSDATASYAAALQVALTAEQANRIDGKIAEAALAAMASAEAEGIPKSDLAFLSALRMLARGDEEAARESLRRALAIEPRYFNALALALRLDARRLDRGRSAPAACMAAFEDTMGTLARISDLEPCHRVAAHLETFVARDMRDPRSSPSFDAIQVYLAVLSGTMDVAQDARSRLRARQDLACRQQAGSVLDQLLAVGDAR